MHGVGLVHKGQQAVVADEVALGEVLLAAVSGDRGDHLAVVQIDPGLAQFGAGCLVGGAGVVALLLGHGVLVIQGAHALPFALGRHILGFGLLHAGFVLVALQLEEQLSFLDEIAFIIEALLDDGLHAGTHLDGAGTRGLGLELQGPGNVGRFDLVNGHRRGHAALLFLLAVLAGGQRKGTQKGNCQIQTCIHRISVADTASSMIEATVNHTLSKKASKRGTLIRLEKPCYFMGLQRRVKICKILEKQDKIVGCHVAIRLCCQLPRFARYCGFL